MSASTRPVNIHVSKSKGITIEWADGLKTEYGLRFLRDRCPCATCTEAHGPAPKKDEAAGNPFALYQPALRIDSVSPAGAYAITIRWNDGHDTGIYTWTYLRAIAPERQP